jgi:MoaA/NifB/PqqE/SkfB family radical SAM enzyme
MRATLSTSLSVGKVDAEAYVNSGLDFMIMSIDGATQPVYEMYRRNGNIEYVYQNIRNLVAARDKLGRGTPILHWQFLAFEHNQHEIPLAIERARELGVDQIQIVTPNDVSWDVPSVKPSSTAEGRLIPFTETAETRIRRNIIGYEDAAATEVIDREFERSWSASVLQPDNEPVKPSDHACRWIYTNMTVDAMGRVIPCCAAPSKNYDLVFGNVSETEEAFNSDKYLLSRQHFANPSAYQAAKQLKVLNQDPHCVNCKWDQEHTNVNNEHVRQYLHAIAGDALDASAMNTLVGW